MNPPPVKAVSRLAIAIAALIVFVSPALAQKVPDPFTREVIIKSTLLTFNDANVTGNYTVLHAKLSKPFRDKFSPEQLAGVFKVFRDNHIDFDLIVAKAPIASQPPAVNGNGVLRLYGYFETTPSRLHYELEFILSDGEWKPTQIRVQFKPLK